jgi:transcription termination factor Rho
MLEISQLKEKKLTELQDIAKQLKISKYRSLKKLDLVYQILDHQAANPIAAAPKVENRNDKRETVYNEAKTMHRKHSKKL